MKVVTIQVQAVRADALEPGPGIKTGRGPEGVGHVEHRAASERVGGVDCCVEQGSTGARAVEAVRHHQSTDRSELVHR